MAESLKASALTSEDAFLALIDSFFPAQHARLTVGRGDDCAVLACPDHVCMSSDLFLENVHFRRSYFSPEDIGYKSLAVNISDIAAMGASPLGFALNLMISPGLADTFWSGFFRGMAALADEYGLYLAGGDLSSSEFLGVAISIWGQQVPGGRFLQRAQGLPGDVLFIVGDIGLARTGLELLENSPSQARKCPEAVQALLRPVPRVREGRQLAAMPAVRALMDVSDGLVRDLPRFLGPGMGCQLIIDAASLHPEVLRFAEVHGKDPVAWSLLGGDDYALLGAVDANQWFALQERVPHARCLGTISSDPGLVCNGKNLQFQGFDHFSS